MGCDWQTSLGEVEDENKEQVEKMTTCKEESGDMSNSNTISSDEMMFEPSEFIPMKEKVFVDENVGYLYSKMYLLLKALSEIKSATS